MEYGLKFVGMAKALVNDHAFVNNMRDKEDYRCGCDHANYCIARMYSREMACHKHLTNLPKSILKELK